MEIFLLIIIGLLVTGLLILYRRLSRLEDEVTVMKYIFVTKEEDGTYTFTDRGGNKIFE